MFSLERNCHSADVYIRNRQIETIVCLGRIIICVVDDETKVKRREEQNVYKPYCKMKEQNFLHFFFTLNLTPSTQ